MKFEDYINILDENLQLSEQNPIWVGNLLFIKLMIRKSVVISDCVTSVLPWILMSLNLNPI